MTLTQVVAADDHDATVAIGIHGQACALACYRHFAAADDLAANGHAALDHVESEVLPFIR